MDPKEIESEDVEWIHFAQHNVQWGPPIRLVWGLLPAGEKLRYQMNRGAGRDHELFWTQ
jgi:hypothetical protein